MKQQGSHPEYNERELAEIDELNRLDYNKVPITQTKLWKRLTTFVAAAIVISLLLPIAILILSGTNENNQAQISNEITIPTPDFQLIDSNNNRIQLSAELDNNAVVILLFYRGFF